MIPLACSIPTRVCSACCSWPSTVWARSSSRCCSSPMVATSAIACTTASASWSIPPGSVRNRLKAPRMAPRSRNGTAWTERNPAETARGANSGHRSLAVSRSSVLTGAPVVKQSWQGPSSFWTWKSSSRWVRSCDAATNCRPPVSSTSRIPPRPRARAAPPVRSATRRTRPRRSPPPRCPRGPRRSRRGAVHDWGRCHGLQPCDPLFLDVSTPSMSTVSRHVAPTTRPAGRA
jgi:hypothetical protein